MVPASNNEDNGAQELQRAEAKLVKLHKMERNLQRSAIEEGISFADFREHRMKLKPNERS